MRMAKKRLEDPARRFRDAEPPKTVNPGLKRAVNVSVDAGILDMAKGMNINLSRVLEQALSDLTAEERARRFYEENKASIDAYNAFIEKHGTLAEAYYGKGAFDDPSV